MLLDQNRLGHFHPGDGPWAIRCAAVGDATLPYTGDVLEFVKHEITGVERVLRIVILLLFTSSYKI